MFGRVPKHGAAFLGTRPNISESHSEISTPVPFCTHSGHWTGRPNAQAQAQAHASVARRNHAHPLSHRTHTLPSKQTCVAQVGWVSSKIRPFVPRAGGCETNLDMMGKTWLQPWDHTPPARINSRNYSYCYFLSRPESCYGRSPLGPPVHHRFTAKPHIMGCESDLQSNTRRNF